MWAGGGRYEGGESHFNATRAVFVWQSHGLFPSSYSQCFYPSWSHINQQQALSIEQSAKDPKSLGGESIYVNKCVYICISMDPRDAKAADGKREGDRVRGKQEEERGAERVCCRGLRRQPPKCREVWELHPSREMSGV